MREKLAELVGTRCSFQGEFVRFGKKSGYKGILITILLKDIIDVGSDKIVTDHLWFTQGKRFEKLSLREGDIVRFDARITGYVKGYKGRRRYIDEDDLDYKPVESDYRLSFPSKLRKVKEGNIGNSELRGEMVTLEPMLLPKPRLTQENLDSFK